MYDYITEHSLKPTLYMAYTLLIRLEDRYMLMYTHSKLKSAVKHYGLQWNLSLMDTFGPNFFFVINTEVFLMKR